MPLIISGGKTPPRKASRVVPGQRSSALLANLARAEMDRIVDAVLDEVATVVPDWQDMSDAQTVLIMLGELQARWSERIDATARDIAARWVDAVDQRDKDEVADSLRKALGVDQARILDGPATRGIVTTLGREAAATIRTIPGELLANIADAVAKSYQQEALPEGRTLAQEIAHISGHAHKRAKFIAKDQTQKMHGMVTEARHTELGIREFVWRTMRDQRVVGAPGGRYPKPSKLHGNHYEREGRRYSWDDLPADGGPGWPIGCRCYAEPVIDMDTLDVVEVSQPVMTEVEQVRPTVPPRTRVTPEPYPGYTAQRDALAAKLVESERRKAQALEQARSGDLDRQAYERLLAEARREVAQLKSAITRLKTRAKSKTTPVLTTTTVVQSDSKQVSV